MDYASIAALQIRDVPEDGRRVLTAGAAARVAPEHLVVEVFAAVRGRWLDGHLDAGRARDVLAALSDAALDLVATVALLPRMWELRDNLTGYDAASVAVAEAVGAPLVTCDARLVRAPRLSCGVRLGLPAT